MRVENVSSKLRQKYEYSITLNLYSKIAIVCGYPHATKFIINFCTQSQDSFQALPLKYYHLFAHQKHCLYILCVIWDKLEPYLVYPPIFIYYVNNSQSKRAMSVSVRTITSRRNWSLIHIQE